MPWEFTDHHVRPNVFYWSPKARHAGHAHGPHRLHPVACKHHAAWPRTANTGADSGPPNVQVSAPWFTLARAGSPRASRGAGQAQGGAGQLPSGEEADFPGAAWRL